MEENIPNTKVCLNPECGIQFIAKRTNQLYHNLDCKKRANNAKAHENHLIINKYNRRLYLNWKILNEFYKDSFTEVDVDLLRLNQYDFSMSTGSIKDNNGKILIYCYNYILEPITTNLLKIRINDAY